MEAKSKTELLQRETKFERAISCAWRNPALTAATFYFTLFIVAFACESTRKGGRSIERESLLPFDDEEEP